MKNNNLKIYLVGGAVRDQLLNIPPKDKDYVVVGSFEQEMLSLGFTQVGKDFPVFLHAKTKEEYALARREKKVSAGYQGFKFDFAQDVTLEDDLKRRDLTINAIAFDGENYIDPFNGIDDLKNKILKPVSNAFQEDPVRILRLARFKARFSDFTLHPLCFEEAAKMKDELCSLKPERVRLEMEKAFLENKPSLFFETLKDLNILDLIFPSIAALINVPQPVQYHPEGDAFIHTMQVLNEVRSKTNNLNCLYAGLLHDIGKSVTPKERLPKHIGHEKNGIPLAENFLNQFGINKQKKFILAFVKYHLHMHRLLELKEKTIIEVLDAFKIRSTSDQSFKDLIICSNADNNSRHETFEQEDYLKKIIAKLECLDLHDIPHDAKNKKELVLMKKIKAIKPISQEKCH